MPLLQDGVRTELEKLKVRPVNIAFGEVVIEEKQLSKEHSQKIAANVQLTAPQATITMQKHIPTSVLQNALSKAGNYTITKQTGECTTTKP